jgi:hypothetical protein
MQILFGLPGAVLDVPTFPLNEIADLTIFVRKSPKNLVDFIKTAASSHIAVIILTN